MRVNRKLPCIVGVAQHTWHPGQGDAPHPLAQMLAVSRRAAADCGNLAILERVDEVDAVRSLSWHYDDLPGALAAALGLPPGARQLSGMSGTSPQRFVCDAAQRILSGERQAVLVTGAEALATRRRARKEGRDLGWPKAAGRREFPFEDPSHPSELAHDIRQAYVTFAILDSARRAHLGLDLDANRRQQASMMAGLSARAAQNPQAWFQKAHTADSLFQLSDRDRMVAYPFTRNTMAFMDVDMAAAILVTSHALADELGIPADRRIYLHGWGYAKELPYIAERAALFHSPAMRAASAQALAMAGVAAADIEHLDLYSCFASNVNFTRDVLGIADADPRPLTVTGGLPYFGGPGNNYTAHAIAAMVEVLRADPGSRGLVTGVGMHMTNHSFAVYSTQPRALHPHVVQPVTSMRCPLVAQAAGRAVIAGYTVVHAGAQPQVLAVCELSSGERCYARCDDPVMADAMQQAEWVGREVTLVAVNGVNTMAC